MKNTSTPLMASAIAALAFATCNTFGGGPDVSMYLVAKGQQFVQFTASAPTLRSDEPPFEFSSFVDPSANGNVSSATLQRLPSGSMITMTNDFGDSQFRVEGRFTTKAALDAAFANGTYQITILTAHQGTQSPSLALGSDAYPNTPHIANWLVLQDADPTAPITVNWDAFTGGTTNDFVQFRVEDETGTNMGSIFQSGEPGSPGGLDGTSTSFMIPSGTLELGRSYSATLLFAHISVLDTTSYPGVPGIAAFFEQTRFDLVTTGSVVDVSQYLLAKGQRYAQTNAGPPVLQTDGSPFRFSANVNPSSNGIVSSATLQLPGGSTSSLTNSPDDNELRVDGRFDSKAAMDLAFPNGTYHLTIATVHQGTKLLTLALGPDDYPNAPHIANWLALQEADPNAPITVTWDAFTGGTTNDFVQFRLESDMGDVLSTGEPGKPDALNGTNTSFTIPASTLMTSQTYSVRVLFASGFFDTTNYPGVLGIRAFYKQTSFNLVTGGPPPPQGQIQFANAEYTGSEGAGSASIELVRTGGAQGEVSVHFLTTALTATPDADYIDISTQVIFADGVTSTNVTVPILEDSLLEGAERVRLGLGNPQGGVVLGRTTNAVLTIVDNESATAGAISFSAAAYQVSESSNQIGIILRRTSGTTGEVGAQVEVVGGSATVDEDYSLPAQGLSFGFGPGQAASTNFITIIPDEIAEGNEDIQLRIASLSGGARLGTITNATVTIIDDEVTIQFASAIYTNLESVPIANILVERTGALGIPVSVHYQAGGLVLAAAGPDPFTATPGADYVPTNGVLEFPAGLARKAFQVRILNDNLVEEDEALPLFLYQPSDNAQLGERSGASLVIRDTDRGGVIQFGVTNINVRENAGTAMLMVTRTMGLASNVTVHIATESFTASGDADYTSFSSNLVFGAREVKKIIRVPIVDDALVEDLETFKVVLSEPTGGASLGAKSLALVNIRDNDRGGLIAFSRAEYVTNENAVAAKILVTRTGGAASNVFVRFSTTEATNNPAMPGDDYTPVDLFLTFDAGQVSQVVMIPLADDDLPDGNKNVALILREVGGGARLGLSNAVLRIRDDESSIALSSTTYAVSESSATVNITVVRAGPILTTARVDFATSDLGGISGAAEGSDYLGTNFTLVFPPGVSMRVVPIRILRDTGAEMDEAFEVHLSNPDGTQLGSISNAVVTIHDAGAVPLAGAEFFKATARGVTNSAFSRSFSASTDIHAVNLGGDTHNIVGSTVRSGIPEIFTITIPDLTGPGTYAFISSGPSDAGYSNGLSPTFSFVTHDAGDGGTIIIDGFDGTRVSGRFSMIMSDDQDGTKFIRATGSFRAIIQ